MTLSPSRRFAIPGELSNPILGNHLGAILVLPKHSGKRWLDVYQFHASVVVREQVNPPLASLLKQVRGVERKTGLRPQELPAAFAGQLHDSALIVPRADIECPSQVVERHHGGIEEVVGVEPDAIQPQPFLGDELSIQRFGFEQVAGLKERMSDRDLKLSLQLLNETDSRRRLGFCLKLKQALDL